MQPISIGASGAAVEDIQNRLVNLGYDIDAQELKDETFGQSTATAVARFRVENNLMLGTEVDDVTWQTLVDESYTLGDRTLYLRLPNYHGRDVRTLQERLNILGFSCGDPDGYFGTYTESAVRQFQENVGIMADGMAFPETYDAIERLKHVWSGNSAKGPHPQGGMTFARAASVLETTDIHVYAEDPISRNVAGRLWNLASATTEHSQLALIEGKELAVDPDPNAIIMVIGSSELPLDSGVANVVVDDIDSLPQRIRTAYESVKEDHGYLRLQLPCGPDYAGTFTVSDAQTFAVMLLDAICAAFNEM